MPLLYSESIKKKKNPNRVIVQVWIILGLGLYFFSLILVYLLKRIFQD